MERKKVCVCEWFVSEVRSVCCVIYHNICDLGRMWKQSKKVKYDREKYPPKKNTHKDNWYKPWYKHGFKKKL